MCNICVAKPSVSDLIIDDIELTGKIRNAEVFSNTSKL